MHFHLVHIARVLYRLRRAKFGTPFKLFVNSHAKVDRFPRLLQSKRKSVHLTARHAPNCSLVFVCWSVVFGLYSAETANQRLPD